MGPRTLKGVVSAAWARLADAGVPNPLVDAAALVALASGLSVSEVRAGHGERGDRAPRLPRPRAPSRPRWRAARRASPSSTSSGTPRSARSSSWSGPGSSSPARDRGGRGARDRGRRRAGRRGRRRRGSRTCARAQARSASRWPSRSPSARVTLVELDAAAFGYLQRNVAAQEVSVRARLEAVKGDARTALAGSLRLVRRRRLQPPVHPARRACRAIPRSPSTTRRSRSTASARTGLRSREGSSPRPRGCFARGAPSSWSTATSRAPTVRAMVEASGRRSREVQTREDYTLRERCVVATRA